MHKPSLLSLDEPTSHRHSVEAVAALAEATSGKPMMVLSSCDDEVVTLLKLRWLYKTFTYVPTMADQNALGVFGFWKQYPINTRRLDRPAKPRKLSTPWMREDGPLGETEVPKVPKSPEASKTAESRATLGTAAPREGVDRNRKVKGGSHRNRVDGSVGEARIRLPRVKHYLILGTRPRDKATSVKRWFRVSTDLTIFMTHFRSDVQPPSLATFTVELVNGGGYDPDNPSDEASLDSDVQYAWAWTLRMTC
ncbi:hypothetical protein EDB89DRAFT_1913359 [Lactarius sanguifluus]|nr:hypothetical protein EDB89DRAFT_1913359 [Lactarius sanguifluus]